MCVSSSSLFCALISSKVVAFHNNQRGQTSLPSPSLPLLLLSVSSTPCLFMGLSSFVLLYGTSYSSELPPGVVSFLFIFGLTPCRAPLANSFLLFFSTFLLILTHLMYLSTLFILFSSRSIPFITSSHNV
jgi:hypothetical protein